MRVRILVVMMLLVPFLLPVQIDAAGFEVTEASISDSKVQIRADREVGITIGSVLNVYRDKEIIADASLGNFKISTRIFLGRVRAIVVQDKQTTARLMEMATHADSEDDLDRIMVGDYALPAYVIPLDRLFEEGKATLHGGAGSILDQAVSFIGRFKPIKVQIEGHSSVDSKKSTDLSQKQVDSIRDFMVKEGDVSKRVY